MHNMEENSVTGICLMTDGRYVVLPLDRIHVAFKKVLEAEYVMSAYDEEECHALYNAATKDTTALELRLAKCLSDYNDSVRDAYLARSAKLAAGRATRTSKEKVNIKVNISHICLGTSVSMFFTWKELGVEARQPSKCEAKNGAYDDTGEWRSGSIKNITKNKFKKYVYECVFDTPGRYTGSFNNVEIKEARINFLKIQALHAAALTSSSDDGLSSLDGDDVMLLAESKHTCTLGRKSKPLGRDETNAGTTAQETLTTQAITPYEAEGVLPSEKEQTVPPAATTTSNENEAQNVSKIGDPQALAQTSTSNGIDADKPCKTGDSLESSESQTSNESNEDLSSQTGQNMAPGESTTKNDTDAGRSWNTGEAVAPPKSTTQIEAVPPLHTTTPNTTVRLRPSEKEDTVAPAHSTTSNETLAKIPTQSEEERIQTKGGNEEEDAKAKEETLPENGEQGGGDQVYNSDDSHDQRGKDNVTQQRLALAKELASAIGDDERSEIENSTSVQRKKNSRRTLQVLRLLKNKIAAAEAQNKPKVAKLLRKAMAKILLNRQRSGAPKKVGSKNLTDAIAVTALDDSSIHAHADRLTMKKRGNDESKGMKNSTRKRAKVKNLKKLHTAVAQADWEEDQSQADDYSYYNAEDDATKEATDEGADDTNDEWYWDQKFQTWVFTGSRKPRKRDLSNKVAKNWLLGMRRNWDTIKMTKLLEKITITREHISKVRNPLFTLTNMSTVCINLNLTFPYA